MINLYKAWKHKRSVRVTNPSSTAGQQAWFNLPFLPGMRKDFRDVRFSDLQGRALIHWRERYTEFSSATFVVKLPGNDKKIFLHYGNGQVASASNGDNTFEFFDDFRTATVINTNKWDVYGTAVISGGALKLGGTSSTSRHITSKLTFGEGYRVIARAKLEQMAGQFNGVGFIYINSGHDMSRGVNFCTYQTAPKTSLMYNTYIDRTLTAAYTSAFHTFDLTRKGGGASRLIVDGSTVINNQTGSYTTALNVGARNYDANKYLYVEYFYVMKYAAVDPSLSLDAKFVVQPKTYTTTMDSLTVATQTGMAAVNTSKEFLPFASRLGLQAQKGFRQPKYYRPAVIGPYSSWKFKGDIRVTTPSSTDGMQQALWIPALFPGMAKDGRDLRFSDIRNNPLPYWIEGIGSDCSVWVRLPANDTKIHFFYGNGQAKSESNGDNTFELFDDFNGSSLDSAKWNQGTTGNGAITVSGGSLRLSATNGYAQVVPKKAFTTPIRVRSVFTVADTAVSSRHRTHSFYTGDSGLFEGKIFWGSYRAAVYDTVSTYMLLNYWNPGIQTIFQLYDYNTNATIYTNSSSNTVSAPQSPFIRVGDGGAPMRGDWSFKFFTVSKWTGGTQPSLSVLRHYPQQPAVIPYYNSIEATTYSGAQATQETRDLRELRDFDVPQVDISKTTADAFWQLNASFAGTMAPKEGSTIKFIAHPQAGDFHLFTGKSIANSPTLGAGGDSLKVQAADAARNLSVQKVPWDAHVVSLTGLYSTWADWITHLIGATKTGLVPVSINSSSALEKQFVFDPKTTRLEAIKKISDYCGFIFHIKWVQIGGVWKAGAYWAAVEDIDMASNGFDLPDPIEFIWPDSTILDQPAVTSEPEEKYNSVTVYGRLADLDYYFAQTACTPEVAVGTEAAREYYIEDNDLYGQGEIWRGEVMAKIEAVKWLIYFTQPHASVSLKLAERYDLELYQRLRFGSGFKEALRELTAAPALEYAQIYDPRDPNQTMLLDLTGVPRPAWLRITDLKYNSAPADNTTEIKAIVDYIYSNADPLIKDPYNQYINVGYLKPPTGDSVSETQAIVNDTTDKQPVNEEGTVMSIEGDQAQVQTTDGRTLTVRIIDPSAPPDLGSKVLCIPDGSGGYYAVTP